MPAWKKKTQPMPNYTASEKETKAYNYCVKNNIRISPYGIQNDNDKWHIAISLGPYKKWEKPHLSPSKYDRNNIWQEFYKMCEYYYDKHRR